MASNKKVITLGLDYSQFSGGITEVNRKMGLLDSEFKLATEQVKKYGTVTDQLTVKQEGLTQKVNLVTQKVKLSKEAYDKALESGKASEKQLDNLEKTYNSNQLALHKLNTELENNEDKLTKAKYSLDSFGSQLGMNKQQIDKFEDGLQTAGKALIAMGVASATMYVDFDSTFSKVGTLADTTVMSMEDLKNGVYEISDQTGKSATGIADALYECLSANVKTGDALKVTLDAAKLAKAGFTETATSVDILTTIMSSYNKTVEDTQKVSDMLVKTQDVGKLTVGELGSSFGKVAGLASEANISLEELLASIATITQSGTEASEAVTTVKAAISNIIKPTAEAAETADKLGLKFNVTALKALGLAGFLELVQKKTHGNIETMAKLFGSTEAVNGIMQLTSEKGSVNFANALDQITNSGGATDNAISKLSGTGSNLKDSFESIRTSLIKVGDALAPIIEMVTDILSFIGNMNPIILATVIIVGTLIVVVHAITAAMIALGMANTIVGTSALGAMAGMSALLPIILAVAVAVAIITGVVGSIRSAMKEAESSASLMTSNAQRAAESVNTNGNSGSRGFANGTNNYPGGEAWVGEAGPELVTFPTGSRIRSNAESKSLTGGDTYNIIIDAKNVKEFNDVVTIMNNYKQKTRQGVLSNG